jgi:protein SYS1
MLYGATVWDPLLIVAQIISVQCLFYLSLGLWLTVFLGEATLQDAVAHIVNGVLIFALRA